MTMSLPAGPPSALPKDLVALRRFATLMDEQFQIPGVGTRIGLDALLGFLPGVGDAGGALLSTWIIVGAFRHRVPLLVILRMVLNVSLDTVVGAVPVLGDVFDILFKENVDNVELIVRHRDPGQPPRSTVGIWLAASLVSALLIALFMSTLWAAGRVFTWLLGTV
jgi:hypothetical protein